MRGVCKMKRLNDAELMELSNEELMELDEDLSLSNDIESQSYLLDIQSIIALKDLKYYALYDLQIGGYKAGIANTCPKTVLEIGADRAFDLSQGDEEPCPKGMSSEEILEQYGYEVREVSKEDYKTILNSNEYGLLTKVTLGK